MRISVPISNKRTNFANKAANLVFPALFAACVPQAKYVDENADLNLLESVCKFRWS